MCFKAKIDFRGEIFTHFLSNFGTKRKKPCILSSFSRFLLIFKHFLSIFAASQFFKAISPKPNTKTLVKGRRNFSIVQWNLKIVKHNY